MPSTSTRTCDSARTADPSARRPPAGVEIVTGARSPKRLPGEAAAHPAQRLLARDGGEYLFVGLRAAGRPAHAVREAFGATASHEPIDAPRLRLAPGDVCFYATDRAPALDFRAPFEATTFLLPADLLGLTDTDVRRIARTPVARSSRLGTLLSPLLSDLARAAAEAGPPVGEMLARNAVNLLATLAAEQLGTAAPAADDREAGTPGPAAAAGASDVRPPVLERVLEFVELHLTDPDLSPEVIARTQHISVRYLHKLFKDEGTTVGRWILRRRLEECRRDLARHGRGGRTIAAVAARWGFLSATHFSRVFRSAYGMSPREWRDTAGNGLRSVSR
ncbi:helix-turn-helix domain-containing protein [Streptomyces asoensis]|uniref:helix-turn-helix domain-containing protein n=1 Tax=Streptomyces asoensis TaxID=249586 RepID=UPI0033C0CEBB